MYKGSKKDRKKDGEEPPNGYIHVRARRGQATDSHSLAERVFVLFFFFFYVLHYLSCCVYRDCG